MKTELPYRLMSFTVGKTKRVAGECPGGYCVRAGERGFGFGIVNRETDEQRNRETEKVGELLAYLEKMPTENFIG